MPGSGKTTLGKLAAKALKIKFLDADTFISDLCKMRIPKIFETVGESGFRNIERIALEKIMDMDNFILATGGGMPCFFDNIQIMNELGTTIFLNPTFEELVNRLKYSKQDRPLLHNLSDSELEIFVRKTLEKRLPFYEQAHFTYNFDEDFVDFLKNSI